MNVIQTVPSACIQRVERGAGTVTGKVQVEIERGPYVNVEVTFAI